jgi:hypothetical protein
MATIPSQTLKNPRKRERTQLVLIESPTKRARKDGPPKLIMVATPPNMTVNVRSGRHNWLSNETRETYKKLLLLMKKDWDAKQDSEETTATDNASPDGECYNF